MSRRNAVRVGLVGATLLILSLLVLAPGHVGFPARPEEIGAEHEDVTTIEQLFRVGRKVQQPLSVNSKESAWIDLENSIPWTSHDGGIEGYTVWSNLYLNGGALVAAKETKEEAHALPSPRAIMSAFEPSHGHPAADESLWSTVIGEDLVHIEFGKRATRLPGITYIFNDPPGKDGYMVYHHHFMHEILLPAARAVASAREKAGLPMDETLLPSRIIFPRCGHEPSWRDEKNMNSWVLRTMLPDAVIEDAMTWNDRAVGDQVYMFEQVVIVDRWAAHSATGDVLSLGRMNANAPQLPAPKHFWDPFHDSMQRAIGNIMPHVGKHALPIVVYIEREHNPQVAPDSSSALIDGLKTLTDRAEVHVTRLNALTQRQKIALISRANIVIGLHSDDLLNVAWMSAGQGNGVVELFEEGGFMLDYHLLAGILGLKHVAVQRDRVVTQDMRINHQLGLRGPQKDGEVDIEASVVLAAVEKLLDELDDGRGDTDRQVYGSKG